MAGTVPALDALAIFVACSNHCSSRLTSHIPALQMVHVAAGRMAWLIVRLPLEVPPAHFFSQVCNLPETGKFDLLELEQKRALADGAPFKNKGAGGAAGHCFSQVHPSLQMQTVQCAVAQNVAPPGVPAHGPIVPAASPYSSFYTMTVCRSTFQTWCLWCCGSWCTSSPACYI